MTQNTIKKIALSCITLIAPVVVFGQQVTPAATSTVSTGFDINIVLLIIAVFLLFPILISGNAFIMAMKDYLGKNKNNSNPTKKIGTFILLLFAAQVINAQTNDPAAATAASSGFFTGLSPWILMSVIVFEALIIAFFSWLTMIFLKHGTVTETEAVANKVETQSWLSKIWYKMNSFKPISQDADIDTGHDYDGIRELDNITPPWFTFAFACSILFAIVYLYRHHVSNTAPLMAEEYQMEMEAAEAQKVLRLATQTNAIDENTIVMLSATDIEKGKKLFTEKSCITCHGATGGSMPGGVGPNLTDEYWIHGGGIKDVFKSIKYGWPAKGMIAWKDQLSSMQIAQVTSYVMSIKGSKPANAKAPDGELYTEIVTPTDTIAKDTTVKVKK